MIRVAFFGYRGWAFRLFDRVLEGINQSECSLSLVATTRYDAEQIDYDQYPGLRWIDPLDRKSLTALIADHDISVALFYGWSWMVPKKLTQTLDCLCLHPSLLPKYRGGTPFQHQIMNNEQDGGITIFRMNDILDGGDILAQRPISLRGTLREIQDRVVEEGSIATLELLSAYVRNTVQYSTQTNLDQYPPHPRRTPDQSVIPFPELQQWTVNDFYNFVRALDDPFPNCCIVFQSGKKLFAQEVRPVSDLPSNARILHGDGFWNTEWPMYIQLRDGYIQVVRFNN